jgi:flagellar biosynthesis/type III secretory pathway protein FliH
LKGRDAEEYASLVSVHHSPENEAMQMTWADKIEAKGRKEGRKEGREEGADLLRRTLLRQLDQRFGKVPEALQERLAAIRSFAKLSAIAGKILEVQSIEELGIGG